MVSLSLDDALAHHYGYDSFRPQQRETIAHVIDGGDALVLMPTGGGKSLCYQLPALMSDGLTVVVSPLIALMQDQVTALQRTGAHAQYLNSTLSPMEATQVERMVVDGSVRLLYVAPERVNTDGFRALLERRSPSLIAIDEAHCISEWGHEFRPDYRVLRRLTERFVDVPTVACTATATPQVQRDIVEQLDRPRMRTFITSFLRDNLTLRIAPKRKAIERLADRLRAALGESAIVYSGSRKSTESTAEQLRQRGIPAEFYHAGMATGDRTAVQQRFLTGRTPVICATVAFGMGIDKPDVRLVAHLDMPPSIESYYQEIGRAGRDGAPSECLLFYTKGVWHTQMHFIRQVADEAEREQRIQRLRTMMNFCEQSSCRWARILQYFGEQSSGLQCGHCDNCRGEGTAETLPTPVVNPRDPPGPPGRAGLQPLTPAEDELFEALRQTRLRLAQEAGVSAYIVANNRELEELARTRPSTDAELLAVKGFGQRKVEKYGTALLQVIAEYSDNVASAAFQPEQPKQPELALSAPAPPLDADEAKEPPEAWQQRFNTLATWRSLISEQESCELSDLLTYAAMRQLAQDPPQTIAELGRVEGVGALVTERFADEVALILGVPQLSVSPEAPALSEAPPSDPAQPSWRISVDLYQDGHTVLAIAERRMLSPGTVATHLLTALRNGIVVDLERSLPSAVHVEAVRRELQREPEASVSTLHERLEHRLSRPELTLTLAHLCPPEPNVD